MSFDPTKTYRSVLDIDGNIFAYQSGWYYDRYGNRFLTLPVNKEGYAPPTDVEITPAFLGDTLIINSDATEAGADWKYTIARPTSGMTSDQTLTLPTTGGIAARTQDKLSAFAATTSAELAGVISDETGSGALVFATSPVLATPKSTTTIGVGNATPAATGAGMTFPATQSASSDANTLDDYEEGTWTPIISGGTTAGTGTYVTQTGLYTKIGNVVHIQGYISISAHDGTGDMFIADLPFVAFSTTNTFASATIGYLHNCSLSANNYATAYVVPTTNAIALVQSPVGGGASTAIPVDSAFAIMFSATYRTN